VRSESVDIAVGNADLSSRTEAQAARWKRRPVRWMN
jgi:hypothetical protein